MYVKPKARFYSNCTVHGNNTSPTTFQGNSSGTAVKLQMGMYSLTRTKPSGYNSIFVGDCSGGMMSVKTKKRTITNTYSKSGVGVKQKCYPQAYAVMISGRMLPCTGV